VCDAVGVAPLSSAAARGADGAAVPSSEVVSSEAGESSSVAIPPDGWFLIFFRKCNGHLRPSMV
jgi:hypothetical protein